MINQSDSNDLIRLCCNISVNTFCRDTGVAGILGVDSTAV